MVRIESFIFRWLKKKDLVMRETKKTKKIFNIAKKSCFSLVKKLAILVSAKLKQGFFVSLLCKGPTLARGLAIKFQISSIPPSPYSGYERTGN